MQLTQGIGISGYTLEERIGAGAAGEVWSARLGEQRVAVKFMNHVPDPDGKYARSLQAEVGGSPAPSPAPERAASV